MLTTVAFLTALSLAPAAESGQLQITNERLTYGMLGPVRTDAKFLPGDTVYLTFDIDNLKPDDVGRVQYRMGMEVKNAKGKLYYGAAPQKREAFLSLGGTRLPAVAGVDLGTEMAPGEYTLEVTVADQTTKATEKLTRKFEVVPKEFGLLRIHLAYLFAIRNEPVLLPAPPVAVCGQSYRVVFAAGYFQRDSASKVPDVSLEMSVLDENGKPTVAKPLTGVIGKDTAGDPREPQVVTGLQFLLETNRPGKFTIQLKATDNLRKKTTEASIPFTVVEVK